MNGLRPNMQTNDSTVTEIRAHCDANRTKLRRLEKKAHRYAEAACNGDWYHDPTYKGGTTLRLWSITEEDADAYETHLLTSYMAIMGPYAHMVKLNLDPRGYALKIAEQYADGMQKDWGGYGIAAPDR